MKNFLFSRCNPYAVIIKPIFTEKSQLAVAHNRYTFIVDRRSNKKQISRAIAHLYGVTVMKVHVVNYRPRVKKGMRGYRHETGYKKAIIAIASGQMIDFEKLA